MDTIYSLFQKVVKEHENAPAIIENDRTMTFGELSNMVDMITCSFPQEVHSIGIVMRHRTEMIASILAVLKCGGRLCNTAFTATYTSHYRLICPSRAGFSHRAHP